MNELDDFNDWRLGNHFILKEDNVQYGIKAGTPGTTGSTYMDGEKPLGFNLPSSTALSLEFALEQYGLALSSKQKSLAEIHKRHIKNRNIFSFYEHISAAFIFSMVALECFANESIPDDFYHEEKYKTIWTAIGKEAIEKKTSLSTKLGDILPRIFNQSTVKGTVLWTKFLLMKDFRDRVVHFKSKDQLSLSPTHDSIWDDLFVMNFDSPIKTAYSIIESYLKDPTKQPWWFQNIPAGFKTK
jgi:hypothetical protein